MLKKLLFTVSIFTLFLLVSCKNIVNSSVEKASFSFSLGNEKSARVITGANNKDELKIDYSLIRNNKESVKQSETVLASDLYSRKFNFQEVPFGNNYKVSFNIYKDDILIYKALSEPVNIDEIHIEAVLDMELQPCASEIKYELNGGAFTGVKPDTYFMDSLFIMPEPKKEGCRFAGWYKTKDFTGAKIIKLGKDNFFGNVTLYAKWEDLNKTSGITCDLEKDKPVDCGDTIQLSCNDYDEIRYTVDGSEPSKNSSLYNGIFVDRNHVTDKNTFVVKAVAYKDGLNPSDVFSREFTVKTYTVTFDTSKETNIIAPTNIIGLKKGDVLTEEQLNNKAITKEDYEFLGWQHNNVYLNAGDKIEGDITVTPKWREKNTVAGIDFDKVNVDKGESITLSCSTPGAVIHYTIDENNESFECSSGEKILINNNVRITAYGTASGMKQSETVTQDITVKTYKVTFNNGGHGTAPTEITDLNKNDTLNEQLKALQCTGYAFNGWYTEDGKLFTSTTPITENKTLTARWKQNISPVTVMVNGIDSVSGDNKVDNGDFVKLGNSIDNVTIYYTTDGSEPTKSSIKYETPFKIESDVTIKAFAVKDGMVDSNVVSREFTVKTYTVTFDTSKETNITVPTEITGLKKGDVLTEELLKDKAITKDNYEFLGWWIGNTPVKDYVITSDITVTPKWNSFNKVLPVSFSITGSVDKNDELVLSCGTPGSTIYYSVDKAGFSKYSADTKIIITKDTNIRAYGTVSGMEQGETVEQNYTIKTYKVTFNNGGHGTAPTEITGLNKNDKLTDEQLKALDCTGYTFNGWYTEDGRPFTSTTPITENKTLTARWNINKYTITYETEISEKPENKTVNYNYVLTDYDLRPIKRDKYNFLGWTINGRYVNAGYEIKENITLTASWKPWDNVSNVVIKAETNAESTDVDYKETVSLSCGTEGATIYYTTDGSEPTNKSNVYKDPIEITSENTETIKAFAVKDGMVDSDVVSKIYNIRKYTVTFDTSSETNITAPTEITGLKKGEVLTKEQLEDKNITKQNYEFLGWQYNNVDVKAGYVITSNITVTPKWREYDTVAPVTFSKDGNIDSGEKITLSCPTVGATIYYTDDEQDPVSSTSRKIYSNPIGITGAKRIRAVAQLEGMRTSEITEASYTINKYTVTFENGGRGTAPDKITGKVLNDTLSGIESKGIDCAGYIFNGWYTSDGIEFTSNTPIIRNITLTAKWTPITYTVVFDGNGSDGGSMSSQTLTYDTPEALTKCGFTKTGYTFAGWTISKDSVDVTYKDSESVSNLKNVQGGTITLYAQWIPITYSIKYELNGGTNDSGNPIEYTVNTETINCVDPTKTGYTFDGWYSDVDCYEQVQNIPKGSTGNITLYAEWTPITYEVVFNGNGSDGGSIPTQTLTYDDTSVVLSTNTYIKTGYTFAGWNTQADGQGTSVSKEHTGTALNLSTTNNGTVTLYAQWTPITYTVVFNGNGSDGGSMSNQILTYDKTEALTACGFTKTGYTFNGWATSQSSVEVPYKDGASVSNLKNVQGETITLYAKWTINQYIITYNTGCDTSIGKKTVDYDYVLKDSDLSSNNLTKTGYTFLGWYIGKDKIEASTNYKVTDNITLMGRWQLTQFNLSESPKSVGSQMINGEMYSRVEFGDWPQTLKPDYVTIDESKTVSYNGWICYKGDDGFYYVKMSVTLNSTSASSTGGYEKFSDGSKIENGTERYFKMEPIRWRVLTDNYNNTGNKLLLAERALSTNPLDTNSTYSGGPRKVLVDSAFNHNTYQGGCFLDRAFSSAAKDKIANTNLNIGDVTLSDKLFLLNETEAFSEIYGFTGEYYRKRFPTDFAKATNVYIDMEATWWWLRDDGKQVGGDSTIHTYSSNSIDGGIVPALCLPASVVIQH